MSSPEGPDSHKRSRPEVVRAETRRIPPGPSRTVPPLAGFQTWPELTGMLSGLIPPASPRNGTLQQRVVVPAVARQPYEIAATCREPTDVRGSLGPMKRAREAAAAHRAAGSVSRTSTLGSPGIDCRLARPRLGAPARAKRGATPWCRRSMSTRSGRAGQPSTCGARRSVTSPRSAATTSSSVKGLFLPTDLYVPLSRVTTLNEAQSTFEVNVPKEKIEAMGWQNPPAGAAGRHGRKGRPQYPHCAKSTPPRSRLPRRRRGNAEGRPFSLRLPGSVLVIELRQIGRNMNGSGRTGIATTITTLIRGAGPCPAARSRAGGTTSRMRRDRVSGSKATSPSPRPRRGWPAPRPGRAGRSSRRPETRG